MKRIMNDAARLAYLKDWYLRHAGDYCPHDAAPPQSWSEHFAWLLARIDTLERERTR